MIVTTSMRLPNYSEKAIEQVIEQSIGKPAFDENRNPKGTIIHAKRDEEDSKVIHFEINLGVFE